MKFFLSVLVVALMAVACNPIVTPVDDPVVDDGKGTKESPFTVAGALKKASGDAWVKGYIVGFMLPGDVNTPVFSAETDTLDTNVLIADTIDGIKQYMAVQLPFGDVRDGVNLAKNKANLHQPILVYGQITKYFGKTGIKGTQYAKVGDKEFGKEPFDMSKLVEGKGTKEEPWNVAGGVMNQGSKDNGKPAFIKGYIVGIYNFDAEEKFQFEADTINTNLLIADENGNSPKYFMSVQLPAGDVRNALNLKDHQDNLGKEVVLFGNLEPYCGVEGLKNVSWAKFDGKEYGSLPIDPSDALFYESFTKSIGQFTVVDIVKPEALKNIWSYDGKYKCVKATAFSSTKQDGEGWLVSPAIDMSKATTATLSFENAGNYFVDPAKELTLWVSTTSDGTSFNEGWTQLTIDAYSSGKFAWENATVDLKDYCGKGNVRFAFKYISTPEMCGTWEIRNFVIQ